MPKLHPISGLAACGTAGGRVSFGSRTGEAFQLCDGGCTFWLNADEIAYLGPLSGSWGGGTPPGTAPQAVNIHTGARRPLEGVAPGVTLRTASFLAAGGGRWQAAQAGAGATFGSCGEFPGGSVSRATTDSRGAASADGTIALIDVYQGQFNGFRLSRPGGAIVPPGGQPGIGAGEPDQYYLTVIDANRAIWPRAGSWGTFGLAAPIWIPGSLRACYVELAGVAYIVHWLDAIGLVARRVDSDHGKVLSRAGHEFHYDAIAWNGRIRIAWANVDGEPPGSLEIVEWDGASELEDLTPAPPIPRPTFVFAHPVSVYPFKAEGSGRPDLFTLGTYSEKPAPPSPMPADRLLLTHDGAADWTIPVGALRSFDLVLWELYRLKSETLAQSAARWERQTRANLEQWPRDCGVVPMFYNQFNPDTGQWLWTDPEVLEGLEYLDAIVNLSPRLKVIAPFSFDRENGIKPNPNLSRTFDDCVAAAARAGEATLTPIPKPPDPKPPDPTPPDPPKPVPPFRALVALKGVTMQGFVKIHTDAPHYTGVSPRPGAGNGDARFPVYYARPGEPDAGGAWEMVELTKAGNGFAARYVEANRQLSIQQDGRMESREAGAIGPFEIFQIRTEEGTGRNVLYRDDLVGVVLEVELVK